MIALRAMRLTPRGRPMVAPTTGTVDVVGRRLAAAGDFVATKSHRPKGAHTVFPSEIRKNALHFFGGGSEPPPYDIFPDNAVESGKWKVESGKWKVESGKWKVENCPCWKRGGGFLPSPSSLCSATSPKGRGKERFLSVKFRFGCWLGMHRRAAACCRR